MGVNTKDIKLLWGRSGNRCAKCKRELTQDTIAVTSTFTLGEQAHIVGEKESAKRGKSILTEDERNSYHNLILLCPNCHTEIDKNDSDWPVEKLHAFKSQHELWVIETLSETIDHVALANSTVASYLVDFAVKKCELESWMEWSSYVVATDPFWWQSVVDGVHEFRHQVVGAIWPSGLDEFKFATISFSVFMHRAVEIFLKYAELSGSKYRAIKFYKLPPFPNPTYSEDLEKYKQWLSECDSSFYEAVKAANWFGDVVRRYINPMFFVTKGKFVDRGRAI